jgi:cleavage stimulation factor subunit 2
MVSANSQVFMSPSTSHLTSGSRLPFHIDHETALSAVRNLNNVDVGGRPLRIDLADSDPFLEGKTTVRGELIDGGETRAQWRERENAKRERESDSTKDKTSFLRNLPQGVPLPLGASALDMISQTLATMNPTQLVEVLAQFKVRHPWPYQSSFHPTDHPSSSRR